MNWNSSSSGGADTILTSSEIIPSSVTALWITFSGLQNFDSWAQTQTLPNNHKYKPVTQDDNYEYYLGSNKKYIQVIPSDPESPTTKLTLQKVSNDVPLEGYQDPKNASDYQAILNWLLGVEG